MFMVYALIEINTSMLRNVYNNYCAWFLREEDFVIIIYEDCDGIYNFELVDVFIYTLYYFLLKSHQRWYDTKSCNQFSARYQFPGLTWCNGFPIVCSTNLRMPLMLWVLTESLNHLKWFVLSCLVQECALYVMFPLIKNTYIPS